MADAKLKIKQGGITAKFKGTWNAIKKHLGLSETEPLSMATIGKAMKLPRARTMSSFARKRKKPI